MSRLKDRYQQEAVPALTKAFGYTNVMAVPRIRKVVVNMGLGEATANAGPRSRSPPSSSARACRSAPW
jgi:large subunit ribosomal protein L5